ncbi:MAG: (2Fe-2S)-binding protein [Nitrospinota bacterium]|nr:(2Fe-2S)-binding protein [Nitrospinota bacterium]
MDSPPNPDEEIICQCFQVSDETIKNHIKEGNLKEIEEVTEACGAGGGCQSCHMLIQLFIDQHHNKDKPLEDKKEVNEGGVKKRGIFSKLFQRY